MSLQALSDAKTVSLTPLDEARSRLAALVYVADQVHRTELRTEQERTHSRALEPTKAHNLTRAIVPIEELPL